MPSPYIFKRLTLELVCVKMYWKSELAVTACAVAVFVGIREGVSSAVSIPRGR